MCLADFIEPQSLRNSQKYKLIIAPWHLIGKKETCDRLRHFVEAGGTLLLETGFASYDEHMVFNPVVPAFGLAEAFGYREQESLYMMQRSKDNPKQRICLHPTASTSKDISPSPNLSPQPSRRTPS